MLQGFSLAWASIPWMWLFVLGASLVLTLQQWRQNVSAGADWLRRNRQWVSLYEITSAKVYSHGMNMWLHARDKHGRKIRIQLLELELDPYVHDLAYNGLLHSVIAGGAETNSRLHGALHMPRPKAEQSS